MLLDFLLLALCTFRFHLVRVGNVSRCHMFGGNQKGICQEVVDLDLSCEGKQCLVVQIGNFLSLSVGLKDVTLWIIRFLNATQCEVSVQVFF